MKPWFATLIEERAVPIGGSEYAAHPGCSTSRKAWVYHKPDGYGFYCNKCGGKGFVRKGVRSLEELLQGAVLLRDVCESVQPVLPSDFTFELPESASVWLLKSGIGSHRAEEVGIGYSPMLRRAILPVYSGRVLAYWQGRAVFPDQQPKYINPRVSKEQILYTPDSPLDTGRPVCVTEDILSAVRVSSAGFQCCSILGTKLSDHQAMQLGRHPRVDIWLDPDKAGVTASAKIRKELSWYTHTRCVTSEHDPKTYTNYQIKEYLRHE